MPPLPGLRVPEDDRGVLARGGEPKAVRADRHGDDVPGVAVEGVQLGPGVGVPDLDGVPRGYRDQAFAVRAERHQVAETIVAHGEAVKGFLELPQARGIPVPELDGPVVA